MHSCFLTARGRAGSPLETVWVSVCKGKVLTDNQLG